MPEERDRAVRRIHQWKPGEYPGDPDAGDPNVEYVNLGEIAEQDAKQAPKPALWTPGRGPESGMPCPRCEGPTYIIDEKPVAEILGPYGYHPEEGTPPPDDPIVAIACPAHDVVMQLRKSTLPRR